MKRLRLPGRKLPRWLPPGGVFRAAVLVLALLPACSSLVEEEPPVQDSLLVEALVELHLAEARTTAGHPALPVVRDTLLARHGLDRARFDAAMAYYAERPEAFYELYGRVLDQLHAEAREAPAPSTGP